MQPAYLQNKPFSLEFFDYFTRPSFLCTQEEAAIFSRIRQVSANHYHTSKAVLTSPLHQHTLSFLQLATICSVFMGAPEMAQTALCIALCVHMVLGIPFLRSPPPNAQLQEAYTSESQILSQIENRFDALAADLIKAYQTQPTNRQLLRDRAIQIGKIHLSNLFRLTSHLTFFKKRAYQVSSLFFDALVYIAHNQIYDNNRLKILLTKELQLLPSSDNKLSTFINAPQTLFHPTEITLLNQIHKSYSPYTLYRYKALYLLLLPLTTQVYSSPTNLRSLPSIILFMHWLAMTISNPTTTKYLHHCGTETTILFQVQYKLDNAALTLLIDYEKKPSSREALCELSNSLLPKIPEFIKALETQCTFNPDLVPVVTQLLTDVLNHITKKNVTPSHKFLKYLSEINRN